MCKQKCEQCKCKRGTPNDIIEASFNVVGIDKDMNYNDYICTTSPHHIRNKQIDVESTTFTTEDENLYLINLGEI